MKSTFITLAAVLLIAVFGIDAARAQSMALIHHKIVKAQNSAPSTGRDFWFAAPSNEWGVQQIGTYIQIYITSAYNCTVYVSSRYLGGIPGFTAKIAVAAYETSTFTVPEEWEVESSGIPETKAIHVYCNTADLSVYFMSNQFQSSDGSYIIPTIGWGTEYVVAAYGSLYASDGGDSTYDLPSECVVVANQDNTTFEITPSCDCRQCEGGNVYGDANSSFVVFPEGQTQTFNLNRGQCMQFMPIKARNDSDNYDMTGTVIHANQPVGILGASMDAEIPTGFPYPEFVCEMIPPIRTWGETYYASNPIEPPQETNHDYARYLFISSKPGQTILSHDYLSGDHVECTIPNQYGFYWDELELGEKIWSSAPFLCVWYLNSASYPDGLYGEGDPAECIIAPREQHTKNVVFETPLSVKNNAPYDDYANIIVNVKDAARILFDHKGILGYGAQAIDDTFEVFNIPHIAPSAHEVTGDSLGVGVYIYGYGNYESYAWSTASSCATFNSPDTIAPKVDTMDQECLAAFIHVSDSGLLPDGIHQQSGLSSIKLDSSYNMNYQVDNTWIDGSGADTAGYSMSVINPDESAILIVEVYDLAGNVDTITSVYEPQIVSLEPPIRNLGITLVGSSVPNIAFDTIYNTGQVAFDFSTLQLLYGNRGFTIYDSIGGPLDLSPLQPGQRRLIMIKFLAIESEPVVDSIILGNACFDVPENVALIGGAGAADFAVTSQTWTNVPFPPVPGGYVRTVSVENLSSTTITIDSAWWPDQVHFKPATAATAIPGTQYSFPFSVPKSPGSVAFSIAYFPDLNSISTPNRTQGEWFSDSVRLTNGGLSPVYDSLIGNGVTPSETFTEDTTITISCADSGEVVTAYFTITETGTANDAIDRVFQSDPTDFINLVGTLNNGQTWNPATQQQVLTPGETATISVQYIVMDSRDTSLVDYLTAIDEVGDTIGGTSLKLTVNTSDIVGTLNPAEVNFGPVNAGVQNANATQKTFLLSNTGTSPMPIDLLLLSPGGPFNAAFSFTTTPAYPDTLQPGQSMTVAVDFNDSINDAPVQTAWLEIVGDMCNELIDTLTGTIANSGVKETPAPSLNATILPTENGSSLKIIFPAGIAGPVNFTLVNVLGESVLRSMFSAGTQTVDASSLPRGVYFYRLTSSQLNQSGKVILGE